MNRNQYELYHYGVKGMKWGVRKKRDKSSFNTSRRRAMEDSSKNQTDKTLKPLSAKKAIKIGSSVAAGLLVAQGSYAAIWAKTGSETLAYMISPTIGTILGMKYYVWLNS